MDMTDEELDIVEAMGMLNRAIEALGEANRVKNSTVRKAAIGAAKGEATYLIRTADKRLGLS